MITFVPLESYHVVFYNMLLLIVLVVLGQSVNSSLTSSENLSGKSTLGYLVFFIVLVYMGLRPISFAFADMAVYAQSFEGYQNGMELQAEKDVLFEVFMKFCAQIMSANAFFLLCAFLYMLPMYLFSRKKLGDYWFYAFFMFIISFSFWAYGTNGIRNGLATSLFLLAVSRDKKWNIALWMVVAVLVHQSLMVPAIAYVISLFYRNIKMLLFGWLAAIPLSLALGGFWENVFMSVGLIDEDRVAGYLSGRQDLLDQVVEIETGFRWDFLLYGASGIFAGWYFVVKRKFQDEFYKKILAVYIIANALWILVIRANFSNRIAYLSWFLMGAIIIYPLLKNKIVENQHRVIGGIIAVYFLFTYVISVFLPK